MIRKNSYFLLLSFIAAGFAVSLYALKQHYAAFDGGACNVNATFSCDLVNRGQYGKILGFPVSGLGVIGYAMMGVLAINFMRSKDPVVGKMLLALLAGALAFSLYLTYLEAFVIFAWCLICLASLSSVLGASLTGHMLYKQLVPAPEAKKL